MNLYVVVEGNGTEPGVYRSWIPLVNPTLSEVNYLPEVDQNNFLIRSGGGWPYLLKIVESAVEDIKINGKFDRLVISADSEDFSHQQRFDQLNDHVLALGCPCPHHIIIQHFCFETWALGNRKIIPRRPTDSTLQAYKTMYDVMTLDPAQLPPHLEHELNRSQFALKYLRLALRDKGKHVSYSKNNPQVVAHPSYFAQVKDRMDTTTHIDSFRTFIDAFS